MKYTCTKSTNLCDLVGREESTPQGFDFRYGPLALAMMNDEELILEQSIKLPPTMVAKIRMLSGELFVVETERQILPGERFHVTFA